jgi:transcriptional regulator with XRE-family HTH domain
VALSVGRCEVSEPISDLVPFAPEYRDDLAYEAGVSRSYLSQLEKGAYYASLKIVGRLAEALEVEPSELLKVTGREGKRDE